MTNNTSVAKAVTQFLTLLAQANGVIVDSPVLSSWSTAEPNGDPTNEIVKFTWEDQEGVYSTKLTEGGIAAGQWQGASFFCEDDEGDEVQISLLKHVAITPDASARDEILFPRLISEINATQATLDLNALAASMDVSVAEVNALFDRANTAWEAAKAETVGA